MADTRAVILKDEAGKVVHMYEGGHVPAVGDTVAYIQPDGVEDVYVVVSRRWEFGWRRSRHRAQGRQYMLERTHGVIVVVRAEGTE